MQADRKPLRFPRVLSVLTVRRATTLPPIAQQQAEEKTAFISPCLLLDSIPLAPRSTCVQAHSGQDAHSDYQDRPGSWYEDTSTSKPSGFPEPTTPDLAVSSRRDSWFAGTGRAAVSLQSGSSSPPSLLRADRAPSVRQPAESCGRWQPGKVRPCMNSSRAAARSSLRPCPRRAPSLP